MTANAIDMTTLADVKAWLGISAINDDYLFARLITGASDWTQQYLSRDIVQTTYTNITLDGSGNNGQMLPNWPIQSVSAVTIYSADRTSFTTYAASDLTFNERSIWMANGVTFTRGKANIKVSYVGGHTTVPFALAQVVIELVANKYRRRDRIGHVSKSLGGETVTFSTKDLSEDSVRLLAQFADVVPI